nr:MAG TPA: hypothetical protein [Bacteriophage sp.]DAE85425.1 MAG TPA: hypothetical protein [Bacteriophage sp.]
MLPSYSLRFIFYISIILYCALYVNQLFHFLI